MDDVWRQVSAMCLAPRVEVNVTGMIPGDDSLWDHGNHGVLDRPRSPQRSCAVSSSISSPWYFLLGRNPRDRSDPGRARAPGPSKETAASSTTRCSRRLTDRWKRNNPPPPRHTTRQARRGSHLEVGLQSFLTNLMGSTGIEMSWRGWRQGTTGGNEDVNQLQLSRLLSSSRARGQSWRKAPSLASTANLNGAPGL